MEQIISPDRVVAEISDIVHSELAAGRRVALIFSDFSYTVIDRVECIDGVEWNLVLRYLLAVLSIPKDLDDRVAVLWKLPDGSWCKLPELSRDVADALFRNVLVYSYYSRPCKRVGSG